MSYLEDRGESGCDGKSEKHVCIMPSRKQYVSRGDLVCTDFYQGQAGFFSPICVKVGSPCAEDTKNGRQYYYASDGTCSVRGGCLEGFYKSGDNCLPDKDGDKYCWEQGYSRNLFKADVNSIQECVNGVWEDTTRGNSCINFLNGTENSCKDREACFDQRTNKMYFCFIGDTLLFPGHTYQEYRQNFSNGIYAIKLPVIDAGEKCSGLDFGDGHTTNETCLCNNGIDRIVDKGEYCRHTSRFGCTALSETLTLLDSIEDKVCKSTGETCNYSDGKLGCFGDVVSKSENDNSLVNLLAFNSNNKEKAVLGESDIQDRYIIDKDNGIISGIGLGSYVFEYQGDYYMFEVNSDNLIADNGSVQIFVDNNESGVYDEGDLLVSEFASVINILPLEQRYTYDFTEGLNFISFPFIISNIDSRTAAGLLQKLNEVYGDSIYSISKFDGGNWKIVGQNTKVYDNNDFQLLPGEGYVIKAKRDVNIKIVGQPVQFESEEDSAPINLNTGWNLIGLYGTNVKSYTAKSLLEDINIYDFRAINVTQWAKSKQLYEGFQLVDEKEYGFDYPLNKLESYFVRITEGSGNWQPQLGGNK